MKIKKWSICFFVLLTIGFYADAQQISDIRWITPKKTAGADYQTPVYEKIELAVRFDAEIPPEVRYDFEKFNLFAEIYDVNGNLYKRIDGFYMMPEDTLLSHQWRIRFFVPNESRYQVQIGVKKRRRTIRQRQNTIFYITGTAPLPDNHGYLGFKNGSRYLSFSDSTSFFALGECLHLWSDKAAKAHCCVGYDSRNTRKWASYAIRTFTANGGNFARIQMSPYAQELEWHQIGIYDTFQNRAADLDYIFDLCRKQGLYVNLSIFDHLITEDWQKPQKHFPEKPYNPYLDIPAVRNKSTLDEQLLAFFTDPAPRSYIKRKIRYCIARWGYSVHLAGIQVNSELEMVNHNTLFFWNNTRAVYGWAAEMADFVKKTDPRLIASVGGAHYPIGYEKIGSPHDFLSVHHYGFAPTLHRNFNYINNLQVYYRLPKGMPVMIEEFGWIDPKFHLEYKYRSIIHNVIWGSAFSGAFGSAMPFFSGHEVHLDTDQDYQKPYYGAYHYKPVSTFFEGEDFVKTNWTPVANLPEWSREKDADFNNYHIPDSINSQIYYVNLKDKYYYGDIFEERGRTCHLKSTDLMNIISPDGKPVISTNHNRDLEVFALKSEKRIIGWVHLKDFYWKNLAHNPSVPYARDSIEDITDGKITLHDMSDGKYRIEWWNTQPDLPPGIARKAMPAVIIQETGTAVNNTLEISIPKLCNIDDPGNEGRCLPDYGFKIQKVESP